MNWIDMITDNLDTMTDVQKNTCLAFVDNNFDINDTAECLGKNVKTIKDNIKRALKIKSFDVFKEDLEESSEKDLSNTWEFKGSIEGEKYIHMPLPRTGAKRYILTSAVSGAELHEQAFENLLAYAKYTSAELFIGTLMYDVQGWKSRGGSEKRNATHANRSVDPSFFDPRIREYFKDEAVQLCDNLLWLGHIQTLPTAVNPLSSLHNYRGSVSLLYPHPNVMRFDVPTARSNDPKELHTTGCITKKGAYTKTKTGSLADWRHSYGALIVEIDRKGVFFVRQLNMTDDGSFQDVDIYANVPSVKVENGIITPAKVKAFQAGDIHVNQLEEETKEAIWGKNGLVDILKPEYEFNHDTLDFESASHHTARDPFHTYMNHVNNNDSVEEELQKTCDFLRLQHRSWKTIVIVPSNHDDHCLKWLRETHEPDTKNAKIHSYLRTGVYEYISNHNEWQGYNPLEYFARNKGNVPESVIFLKRGESFEVLGIECGMHGDKGANGAKGSLIGLCKAGNKLNIGHSHTAGIREGVYQAGVSARLDMDYTTGSLSSWSRTHIIIYENGKRALLTMRGLKYKADELSPNNKTIKRPSMIPDKWRINQ